MDNLSLLQEMVLRHVEEIQVLPLRSQLRVAGFMKDLAPNFGNFGSYERKLILKFLIEQDEVYDKLDV